MPFKRSLLILSLMLLPAMGFAEVSLSDINHTETGAAFDPALGRQAAPTGGASNLQGIFSSCFNGGRPDFSAAGGFGRSSLGANISTPARVADADPELAQGGTFDLAKATRSLVGSDGLSGRCAKCHNTGKAAPTINSGTLQSPGGLAMILKALAQRNPPMPKDNPNFRSTPEGIAVINFLTAEVNKAAGQAAR